MTHDALSQQAMEPLLSVSSASRSFGGYHAVKDVDLDVQRGEVLGIAGPNGAGKSTLFNLISGVPYGPSSGVITFQGRNIEGLPGHKISRLGLRRTFQADQVFPQLTVLENVTVASRYLVGRGGNAHADAMEMLERVGLAPQRHELGADLSTLSKKKLMIASAIVGDPQLLMLDEPAGGLNVEDQEALASLIGVLNADGLTIVVIEHVLSLLRQVAGRMIVLVAGEVLTTGTPDAVLNDPRVVEAYLGESAA